MTSSQAYCQRISSESYTANVPRHEYIRSREILQTKRISRYQLGKATQQRNDNFTSITTTCSICSLNRCIRANKLVCKSRLNGCDQQAEHSLPKILKYYSRKLVAYREQNRTQTQTLPKPPKVGKTMAQYLKKAIILHTFRVRTPKRPALWELRMWMAYAVRWRWPNLLGPIPPATPSLRL